MPDNTFVVRSADNTILIPGATLMNGTGGGAPALQQDAAYPMSNLLNPSRSSVWATGASPPSPFYVHITINSQNVIGWGFLGMRGATGPGFIDFGYRTAAQGYSIDPAQYTALSTLGGTGPIDKYFAFTSQSMRHLQFTVRFSPAAGFALGKFVVARSKDDWFLDTPGKGSIYSPGSSRVIEVPQVRVRSQAGEQHVTVLSRSAYRRFSFIFNNVAESTKTFLETFAQETNPSTYVAVDGTVYEVLPVPGGITATQVWIGRWDCTVEMESLP